MLKCFMVVIIDMGLVLFHLHNSLHSLSYLLHYFHALFDGIKLIKSKCISLFLLAVAIAALYCHFKGIKCYPGKLYELVCFL